LACVFGGILCFFYDSLRGGNVLGDGAALVSGLFYAGLFLINSFKEGDALSAVFLGQLACGLFFGPLALQEKDMSFNVLGCVLALGVLQSGLGYICLAEATKRISALKASLIGAIEPVLNPLLAAWLCQEWLSLLSLAGAGMVIGTVLVYQLISVKENERD
jgi:drug/metabolite transporter (DMT)-like permease